MVGNRKQSLAVSRTKALRNNLIYRKRKLQERIRAGHRAVERRQR